MAAAEVTTGVSVNGGIVFVNGFSGTNTTAWQTGWTAGGGMEFALSENWSAKGEWMYFDLGSETFLVATLPNFNFHAEADTTGEVVRVGVNYHFGH
jgi:outer membrane immunogenic protein